MAWKPKTKEVSVEELRLAAIELASSQWWQSEPLFVTYIQNEKIQFVPTSIEVSKETYLILFVDITDYEGRRAIALLKELDGRYANSSIKFIIVFDIPYTSHIKDSFIRELIKKINLAYPVTVDFQGHLGTLLRFQSPEAIMTQHGKVIFRVNSQDLEAKLEPTIMAMINAASPGTAFFEPFKIDADYPKPCMEGSRIELGKKLFKSTQTSICTPGFNTDLNGLKLGFFSGGWDFDPNEAKDSESETNHLHGVSLDGAWTQNQERIMLSTGEGKCRIKTKANHFAVLAEAVSTKPVDTHYRAEPEKVVSDCYLTIDSVYPSQEILPEEIEVHFDGRSKLIIGPLQFYPVFSYLDGEEHELELSFQVPNDAVLAIYGIRFGNQ